jgi:2-polyprenyl-3-methyl-5-hydroxy-6-metoxy-1,4-benzoquinol methylase
MNSINITSTAAAASDNPLFQLQQTLYSSTNYTRRRLHRKRLGWVTRAIEKHSASVPGLSALEYGPGSGIYLPVLARNFASVTAADVEHAYLSAIQPLSAKLQGLRLVEDDIQNSHFPDDSFSLILCSEVLEHVPDPERSLKTLHRILRPGGIAIVTTPQRHSLMELSCKIAFLPGVVHVVRQIYREPVLPLGHISLRSCGEFTRAILDSGLEIVQHEKFGLYIPLLAEFGKDWGGRAIELLEQRLSQTALSGLFWTQAYVLRK